jgi:hypothetical protein
MYKFLPSSSLKESAAWYCFHISTTLAKLVENLQPVSLTPVANLTPATALAKLEAKFAAGVIDTCGKFAAGVVDTCGNFAAGVVDTGGRPWLANISTNFQKNLKRF